MSGDGIATEDGAGPEGAEAVSPEAPEASDERAEDAQAAQAERGEAHDRSERHDRGERAERHDRGDRSVPLRKLVELAAKYAEVGPPLAELAFAIGESDIGNQLVRLGTDRETPHVEYWFVAANAARREKRHDDVVRLIIDAVRTACSRDEALAAGEEDRLLHLVRLGFATLMFDLKQLGPESEFARSMLESLPRLEARMGQLAFYRTLLAQALWFSDREASEREWERADALGDAEATWNARGTWYNEAEHDLDKAERAYRRGLEKVPQSALLMHNLAQILVEKAKRPGTAPGEAHRLLNQATEKLRMALRQDAPRLRRHIHATRDRLEDLRRTLPQGERRGAPGDRGPRGGGRDRDRGGPPANRGPQPDRGRGPDVRPRDNRAAGPRPAVRPEQKFLVDGKMSLGEMILAKLKEKEAK